MLTTLCNFFHYRYIMIVKRDRDTFSSISWTSFLTFPSSILAQVSVHVNWSGGNTFLNVKPYKKILTLHWQVSLEAPLNGTHHPHHISAIFCVLVYSYKKTAWSCRAQAFWEVILNSGRHPWTMYKRFLYYWKWWDQYVTFSLNK